MKNLGFRSHKPKIYMGTDHAGFAMKEKLIPFVESLGYEVVDCGAHKYDGTDDYPDFIEPVAKAVALNPENNIGIILGGSGQGEAIVANRFPNVRATVYYGEPSIFHGHAFIKISREHNDANILSLGARFLSIAKAKKAVKVWLLTKFSNEERHVRRIKKIEKISREVKHNLDFK
ncbi:MAG: RpiB/LacA/LacB family sugar-phosphate isomerase [Candidatus Paceibacterota bacterium]|jgi:ribose 5-phosphate isomerase B